MPRLSSCPNCWRQVLVPPDAVRAVRVRCPLCQAEFDLRVIQEAALPELILLDGAQPDVEHALGEESSLPGASEGTGSRPSSHVLDDYRSGGADWDPAEQGRLGYAVLSESSIGVAELPAPADEAATAGAAIDELAAAEAGDLPPRDDAQPPPDETWAATAGSLSDAPSADSGADSTSAEFNFYASPAAHDDTASVEIAARPGKRREVNMAVELVKVVAGGFVGLVIAYEVLLFFFHRDPLDLAGRLPRWMVPASLESSEESP